MNDEFIAKQQQRERGYSVAEVFEDVEARRKDIKDIIVMTVDKDDLVDINYSTSDVSKLIGHLEITKQSIIQEL